MQQRRGFLKLVLTSLAGAVLAPFRVLLGAEKSAVLTRPGAASALAASDEAVVRAFYGEGWSRGSRQVLTFHTATAAACARLFDRYRAAFPDLRVDVQSIQKSGEEILVRWSAQGTHRGSLDGHAPTGRRAQATGLTKMKIVGGKIVSTVAEWDEGALKAQLAPRKLG